MNIIFIDAVCYSIDFEHIKKFSFIFANLWLGKANNAGYNLKRLIL